MALTDLNVEETMILVTAVANLLTAGLTEEELDTLEAFLTLLADTVALITVKEGGDVTI